MRFINSLKMYQSIFYLCLVIWTVSGKQAFIHVLLPEAACCWGQLTHELPGQSSPAQGPAALWCRAEGEWGDLCTAQMHKPGGKRNIKTHSPGVPQDWVQRQAAFSSGAGSGLSGARARSVPNDCAAQYLSTCGMLALPSMTNKPKAAQPQGQQRGHQHLQGVPASSTSGKQRQGPGDGTGA